MVAASRAASRARASGRFSRPKQAPTVQLSSTLSAPERLHDLVGAREAVARDAVRRRRR